MTEVTGEFMPVEYDVPPVPETPTSPWRALGWLCFLVLLVCAPAVVWAAYEVLL